MTTREPIDVSDINLPLDDWANSPSFFHQTALACYERGDWHPIRGRVDRALYLARFWISPPVQKKSGVYESGESMLLHWIVRPDDDDAMHDHPWNFRSQILSGGYTEEVPEFGWEPYDDLGPRETEEQTWTVGELNLKESVSLHKILTVEPETWTLVITDKREREWGFWPAGKPWKQWRDYLGIPKAETSSEY